MQYYPPERLLREWDEISSSSMDTDLSDIDPNRLAERKEKQEDDDKQAKQKKKRRPIQPDDYFDYKTKPTLFRNVKKDENDQFPLKLV